MQLEDFVSESLTSVIKGVKKAQDAVQDTNAEIAPSGLAKMHGDQFQYIFKPGRGIVNMFEYDVAVNVSDSSSTKGGIGIVMAAIGVGVQAVQEETNSGVQRIKFSIPVLFPGEEHQ